MAKRLAFIHTVASLPSIFKSLCEELIPDVGLFHIVDESLLQNTIRENRLSPSTMRRLISYLAFAEEAGADLAMVTCSSMGAAVDMGKPLVSIPVYRVDQPMADLAVNTGERIGVAATLQTTLEPTAALIQARAAAIGKKVRVNSKLCQGAFEAVIAGDTARHDAIVSAGLIELMDRVDVVVLAQASMARVVKSMSEAECRVPVLSSPRLAVEHLAKVVPTI